jgi:signal transduction histidine kinase
VFAALARVRRIDLAIAAAFVVFAFVEEAAIGMPGNWWPYALAGFAVLVALRRVAPLLAMAINAVAPLPFFYPPDVVEFRLWQFVAMLIAAYTVGQLVPTWGSDWRARVRGAAGVALILLTALVYWVGEPEDPMGALFFAFGPWALGVMVAVQVRRLAEAAAVRAEIREQQAREAVTEERVRIARELHDMVAHSVTVMVIQAGVVRRQLETGLMVDSELLRGIESSGREAIGELRRTLALLRGDGAETVLATTGLERLDDLVAQVREAGLAVNVRREGEAVRLLPAVDLSAYRIIQEALTNVLKHSQSSKADVDIAFRPEGLFLSVSDDGHAGTTGAGHGLVGMRERVALFDGEFSAGPRPGGGFAVTARLPALTAVSAAA